MKSKARNRSTAAKEVCGLRFLVSYFFEGIGSILIVYQRDS